MRHFFILLVLSFLSMSSFAKGPCAADRDKFCAGVLPGQGKVAACLKQNEEKLSSDCKQHRHAIHEKWKNVQAVCQQDVMKHCGKDKDPEGSVVRCLRSHSAELTESCRAALPTSSARADAKATPAS